MFEALGLEILKRIAPSIFTLSGSAATSTKYQHISTLYVIEGLKQEGFLPTWASQCRSRTADKRAHTKHMLRFRHVDAKPDNKGLYPEIVLINSHDGLSSYRILAGVFRQVCTNGLIAGKSYEEVRVLHKGDIVNNVIEGTYKVIVQSKKLIESAEAMSAINLSPVEKAIYAKAAHAIRFDSEVGKSFEPSKILCPRRFEECNKSDLFTTFNIAQENIIKGGLKGYVRNAAGRLQRTSARAVNNIDHNTALNRSLWTLTEEMMRLKA